MLFTIHILNYAFATVCYSVTEQNSFVKTLFTNAVNIRFYISDKYITRNFLHDIVKKNTRTKQMFQNFASVFLHFFFYFFACYQLLKKYFIKHMRSFESFLFPSYTWIKNKSVKKRVNKPLYINIGSVIHDPFVQSHKWCPS